MDALLQLIFFGLGGSKALEIYPPKRGEPIEKLIMSKEPTRLNRAIGLFDEIFREVNTIISTFDYASAELEHESQINKKPFSTEEANLKLQNFDKGIDNTIRNEKRIMKNINK